MNFILRYGEQPIFDFDYQQLAKEMWFATYDGKDIELSHGANETLNNPKYYGMSIRWDKWLNDSRWDNRELAPYGRESIEIHKMKSRNDNQTYLYVQTLHQKVLSVDQRALYRFIYMLTNPFNARISEDEGKTWQTTRDFEKKHQLVMHLDFTVVNNMSLVEAQSLKLIEEEDRKDVIYTYD